MFIVVKHQIRDPKVFSDKGSALLKKLPEGVHAHLFLPDKNMSSAVCLWEAPSIDKVKTFLEKEVGGYAQNDYYEVDATKAVGLDRIGLATTG